MSSKPDIAEDQFPEFAERLRVAQPGDVVRIPVGMSHTGVKKLVNDIRQEQITTKSRHLAEEISDLLVQLIQNEMERKL